MPEVDLNIIDELPISERSKNMYRHTIMELNRQLGFENRAYYINTDWYLKNIDSVIEAIHQKWDIKTKRDLTNRLNHLQSVYKQEAPRDLAKFRNLIKPHIDKLPTEITRTDVVIDWNELKPKLYRYALDKDNSLPMRMVYLFYSYDYVFRPSEFFNTATMSPEHPNYLNLDTGEYIIRDTKNKQPRELIIEPELLEEIKELRMETHTSEHDPLISRLGDFYKPGYTIRHPNDIPNVYQIRHSFETDNWNNSKSVGESTAKSRAIGHSAKTAIDNYYETDNCHPLIKPYVKSDVSESVLVQLIREVLPLYKPQCPWLKKNKDSICIEQKKIKELLNEQKKGNFSSKLIGEALIDIFGEPQKKISSLISRKGWILHPESGSVVSEN